MNTMPDPTCPKCGQERALIVPDESAIGPSVLLWYCITCGDDDRRRHKAELNKLAVWEAWATGAALPARADGEVTND